MCHCPMPAMWRSLVRRTSAGQRANNLDPLTYTVVWLGGGRLGGGPVLASGTWTGLAVTVPIATTWTAPDSSDQVVLQVSGNVSSDIECGLSLSGHYTNLNSTL